MSLWRSGIFWAVLAFVGGLGNLVFQAIIKRRLGVNAYGDANGLLSSIQMLGLPMQMASTAVIYYIANYKSHNDEARLHGLLAGCQSFLFKATIVVSVLAIALATPFAHFFGFSATEIFAAILCVLVGLWSTFATALCQGMSWFKRLAIVNFVAVLMRLTFGWLVTKRFPTAEMALSATTFSLLATLGLLFWWKAIFRHGTERVSPWNREFFGFLTVAAGFVGGNYFFSQGDVLVAKRYFSHADNDFYVTAGVFARAVPGAVSPLLNVFFTSRSGRRGDRSSHDQKVLLGLYGVGLACGAVFLIFFREPLLKVLGKYSPQSAVLIPRYAFALALAGLSQAIGTWSLASRWFKIALLYGGLGIAYWLVLLAIGTSPDRLLNGMLTGASVCFVILCGAWLNTLRKKAVAIS